MNESNYLPWNSLATASQAKQAIVIGAGIAGASMAYSLAQRGIKVTIIDKENRAGQHGSGNAVGLMMPALTTDLSPFSEYYIQAFKYSTGQAQALAGSHSFGWQQSGIIQLSYNEKQKRKHAKWLKIPAYKQFIAAVSQQQVKYLSGVAFSFPGIYYKNAAWICPSEFVLTHLEAAQSLITPCFGQQITEIKYVARQWEVVNEQGNCIAKAPILVIANAADSATLIKDIPLSMRCVRGQISMIQNNSTIAALKIPVCYDGYLVPTRAEKQWLGASFSEKDTMENLIEDRKQIIQQLQNVHPEFVSLSKEINDIRQDRTAFRCCSTDYLPLVGPVPCREYYLNQYQRLIQDRRPSSYQSAAYHPGLYLNIAHGSRGMISAPYASELIAREITGETLGISTKIREHIHPGRFLIRSLKTKPSEKYQRK